MEARILDRLVKEVDQAQGKVLIGFQLKELSLSRSIQLATKIKQFRGNKVKLIAGGTYATAEHSALLGVFDYVVVGSGEGILKVLDTVFQGKDIDPVVMAPPIGFEYPLFSDCWVLNEKGDIKQQRLRPLVHPQYNARKALEMMLGIGCSYSCSYCEVAALRGIFGNRYKISFAKPEQAVELMSRELSQDPDIDYIYIFDEDFLLKPTWWIERFAQLYAENLGLPFFIFATPFSVRKWPRNVVALTYAGLDTINMGVQSGSEMVARGLLGRRESKDEIKMCVEFLAQLHVEGKIASPPMLDFIILNPYETLDDLLETCHLMRELPTPFDTVMHCMSFFRGTPLYDSAVNDGMIPTEYRFRHDLHDFMSRLLENELWLDYSNGKSRQWLFLNVLLYGMRGSHKVSEGTRYCGNLTETLLTEELARIKSVSYDDAVSLACSLPNPMEGAYFNWETNQRLVTPCDLKVQKKREGQVLFFL